ncbi:MAG: translocation/assembly module TamB domain-containing protein [Magnetospirillum sp.]|nr:translocation/assembly module TamB domain-containing protein [Magnetospirillum sp.]
MISTPWLRRLILGVAALAATMVFGLGGFLVFLHSRPGERWTSGTLEDRLPGLELDGYRLGWPFRMRADHLRLADEHGTWLEVTQPELVWHPLRLWRRMLDIDRLVAARVDIHRLPETGGSGDGQGGMPSGTLRLDELKAPIHLDAAVLGQPLDLELAGTFQMQGQMQGGGGDVDLSLRAGDGFARLAGTAGPDYLDLRWYLRLPDLTRLQRVTGLALSGDATGSGFVVGRLPSPEISGQVEMGTGRVDRLAWNGLALTGKVVPGADRWLTSAQVEIHFPRLDGTPLPVQQARLEAIGDMAPEQGRVRLGHVQLVTPATTLAGAGVIGDWGRDSLLRLRGTADLNALAGGGVTGQVTVRGMVAGDLTQPALRASLTAQASQLATGVEVLDRAVGAEPRAALTAHLAGNRVQVERLRMDGARAALWSAGRVGDRLELWTRLSLPDLSVLAPNLTGAGFASGRVGGAPTAPTLSGLAHLAGLRVGDAPPGDGDVAFDLADLGKPRGTLSADVTVAGTPVNGRAQLDAANGIRLRDLQLASGDARLGGDLWIKDGVQGRLSGSIPELKAWEGLVGRPLAGRVEADAVLDPGHGQSVRLSVRGYDLSSGGLALPVVTAQADLNRLTTTPGGRVDIIAQGRVGDIPLNDITLSASGQPGRVVVERAEVDADKVPVRLLRPVSVSWRDDTVTLPPALLGLGGGRIEASGRLSRGSVQVRARLEGVPLMLVGLAAPVDAVGTVSGSVDASGPVTAPAVRFSLNGRDVGLAAAARGGLGRMTAQLDGNWRDGRVRAQGSLADGQKVQAEASGSFPLPGDGPVQARLRVTGDAARLAEALPLAGHVFAGSLDATAMVSGTMASPAITGRATLSQGRYENLDSGTLITPLTATAELSGDRAQLHAEGGDGGRGRTQLSGTATLDGAYRADITFDRFTALRRDDVEASVTGVLRLEGADEDGRIAGQLAVPRAEVDVGRIRGGGPVTLEVVEINRPGPPPDERKDNPAAAGPVTMALAVQVAVEHAFVRGRGLDSEWQGKLDVGGTLTQPSLTGRLSVARGQFDFLGKQFRLIQDSNITFEGGESIDPSLAVTAEANAADITAQVQIGGTAKTPEFTISSQPTLPQDEVLARVLFGREAGKLSAFQQVQLAQMAATGLTGGGGGFDPIGKIRGFLGLDVLGVGSADDQTASRSARNGERTETGPTLSAGKYIGPDTFVRVDQGTSGLGRVVVEQDVGRGFSLESSLGEQSGGGVGVNWRMDY